MLILNILGHTGVGKTTIARMIQQRLNHVVIKELSQPIKETVAVMNNQNVAWVDLYKDVESPSGMAVKEQLIAVANIGFNTRPDFWWRLPEDRVTIYSDVSHNSWLEYSNNVPTVNILVERRGHSEGEVPEVQNDSVIFNGGSLYDLETDVTKLIERTAALKYS